MRPSSLKPRVLLFRPESAVKRKVAEGWYSNKKASQVLARGFIALMIGVIVGAWLDVESGAWVGIVGGPVLLTAINLRARRRTQAENSQSARGPLQ